MKLARWLGSLLTLTLAADPLQALTRVDLNRDWSFRTEVGAGSVSSWRHAEPEGTVTVQLPHSWNRAGADETYLGTGWYFHRFEMPELPTDGIAQLNFGATFYKSRVWLNGVEIGGHEGGYTAYSFDVSAHLRRDNLLVVAIDNRPGLLTIPGFGARGKPDAWYDWWAYGGIVREVWLDLHGPLRVQQQSIRSTLDGETATVNNRVQLISRGARSGKLIAQVRDPDGRSLPPHALALSLKEGSNDIPLQIELQGIQRWSLDTPNLYQMTLAWEGSDGRRQALANEAFGLREIRITNRHLLINGERVRLTGMTRHADSPWEGLAETAGTWRHDWEDMKQLNMTLTRPVHYAPDPQVARFADEHGVLLIPEIPIWQASEEQLSSPEYLRLAKQQMRALIEQYGNHPSVFAWSVLNESEVGTPGGIQFFRAMRDYIKALDPERYVTLADDNLAKLDHADESAANDADFLMMNQYYGSWHGPREALEGALDKVDRLFPDKMVIISELGFPGTFADNATEADAERVSILREQMPVLARRDWIAGTILWCYQDYRSRRYFWPGQEQGYLEHGLVDHNRQRKPSWFAWAELTQPAHIEARWTEDAKDLPTAFEVVVTPNDPRHLPYYSLAGFRVHWQLLGAENREFASGSVLLSNSGPVAFEHPIRARAEPGPFKLVVNLIRPTGASAQIYELPARASPVDQESRPVGAH